MIRKVIFWFFSILSGLMKNKPSTYIDHFKVDISTVKMSPDRILKSKKTPIKFSVEDLGYFFEKCKYLGNYLFPKFQNIHAYSMQKKVYFYKSSCKLNDFYERKKLKTKKKLFSAIFLENLRLGWKMLHIKVLEFFIIYNFSIEHSPLEGHVSLKIAKNNFQPLNSTPIPQFPIISCLIFVFLLIITLTKF